MEERRHKLVEKFEIYSSDMVKLRDNLVEPSLPYKEIQELTKDLESFTGHADSVALLIQDDKYREAARMYFLMKTSLALYEAEFKLIPIQVYNEMRNAIDHFFRSLTFASSDPDEEIANVTQLSRHLKRAFLDVAKLTCAFYFEKVEAVHNAYPKSVIGAVESGKYLVEFSNRANLAKEAFTHAKISDYKIGGADDNNVVEAYVRAVIAHKEMAHYQRTNLQNIEYTSTKLAIISKLTQLGTVILGVISGLIVYAIQVYLDT
jgi:hypothetical protein